MWQQKKGKVATCCQKLKARFKEHKVRSKGRVGCLTVRRAIKCHTDTHANETRGKAGELLAIVSMSWTTVASEKKTIWWSQLVGWIFLTNFCVKISSVCGMCVCVRVHMAVKFNAANKQFACMWLIIIIYTRAKKGADSAVLLTHPWSLRMGSHVPGCRWEAASLFA